MGQNPNRGGGGLAVIAGAEGWEDIEKFGEQKQLCVWSVENHGTLGQQACEEKPNEITAIPEPLKLLEFKGPIVAIVCQKKIVRHLCVARIGLSLLAIDLSFQGPFAKRMPSTRGRQSER